MFVTLVPIKNAEMVAQLVESKKDIEVSVEEVRSIMKEELGMRYRIAKTLPKQANSTRCLVLRQQYAMQMLSLLQNGTRIINIDESWLSETNFTRMMWSRANKPATVPTSPITHRLALIDDLDTKGRV